MAYRPMGQATGLAGLRGLRGLRGYRGLGQADDSSTTLGAGIDTSNIAITNPLSGYPVPPSSSSAGFDWNATIGGLLNKWTGIAGQVIAPQTTVVRGPGGQTYIQTPAGSPTGAASLAATASGVPIWVWLVGGVGLIFFMSKK